MENVIHENSYLLFWLVFLYLNFFLILNLATKRHGTKNFTPKEDNLRLIETKRNVTKMVIYTSIIFLLGNLFNPIVYICLLVFSLNLKNYFEIISLVSNTLQFGSYGLNMFVCFAFNRKYRLVLKKMFKWKE